MAEALNELEANPLFKQLPVVRAGNYHRFNPDESTAVGSPSVLSVSVVLTALGKAFDP